MEEAKEGQRGPGFLVQAEEATRVEPRPWGHEGAAKPDRELFCGEEIHDDTYHYLGYLATWPRWLRRRELWTNSHSSWTTSRMKRR
jgi:hypothetical protein